MKRFGPLFFFLSSLTFAAEAEIATPDLPMRHAPHYAVFSGPASNSGEIVQWNWDFGDPESGKENRDSGIVTAHRYSKPGTYTISLTTTDRHGGTATDSVEITITKFSGPRFYVSSQNGDDDHDGTAPDRAFRTLTHAYRQAQAAAASCQPVEVLHEAGSQWVSSNPPRPPHPSRLRTYGSGEAPLIKYSSGKFSVNSMDPCQAVWMDGLHFQKGDEPYLDTGEIVEVDTPGSLLTHCTVTHGPLNSKGRGNGEDRTYGIVTDACRVEYSAETPRYIGYAHHGAELNTVFFKCGIDDIHNTVTTKAGPYISHCQDIFAKGLDIDGHELSHVGFRFRSCQRARATELRIKNCASGMNAHFDSKDADWEIPMDNYFENSIIGPIGNLRPENSGFACGRSGEVWVRNCVFHHVARAEQENGVIQIRSKGRDHIDGKLHLYGNTFFANDGPEIKFNNETTQLDIIATNNVFFSPVNPLKEEYAGFFYLKSNQQIDNLLFNGNLWFWEGKTTQDPLFSLGNRRANLSFADWKNVHGKGRDSAYAPASFEDASSLDFRLAEGSRGIDEGLPLPFVLARDLEGKARPQDGNGDGRKAWDMGAFEHGGDQTGSSPEVEIEVLAKELRIRLQDPDGMENLDLTSLWFHVKGKDLTPAFQSLVAHFGTVNENTQGLEISLPFDFRSSRFEVGICDREKNCGQASH